VILEKSKNLNNLRSILFELSLKNFWGAGSQPKFILLLKALQKSEMVYII